MVNVDRTEPNDGAESALPCKRVYLQSLLGVVLKFEAIRTGRFLVLVDHERAREAHAVIAKMPSITITISRTCEGSPAKDQKIASAIEELFDGRPVVLGESRAVRKNQKPSGRRGQYVAQVIGIRHLSVRQYSCKVTRIRGGTIGRRESGFAQHYSARDFVLSRQ